MRTKKGRNKNKFMSQIYDQVGIKQNKISYNILKLYLKTITSICLIRDSKFDSNKSNWPKETS